MLISLLLAGGVLHKVQPTTDRRAQMRVQQLVQDNWVASATRQALQDRGAVVAGLVDLPGFIGS
jgi:hypothetical protein